MLKINKKKNKITFDYCGFTVIKELSDFSLQTVNNIALSLVNEIRVENNIPISSRINCNLIKVLSDGTEIYDVE